jgi:hypothetical protein
MSGARLDALDYAIQLEPDAPVNYLLRGEFWLAAGDYERAWDDLDLARHLAQEALAESDWGYIYQSYTDRAEQRLHQLENEQVLRDDDR